MSKIYGGIFVFFLLLAYSMFVPEVVCTVDWVDSAGKPIQGPFYECKGEFQTRRIGGLEYTKVGNDVYRVGQIHGGWLPPGALRPRVPKRFFLIKLDGPVNWDELRGYIDGRYLSDGKIILNSDGQRMLSLTPPLDIANLHPVPGSGRNNEYATDGRWVLLFDKVVEGADAATFSPIFALELDGSKVESHTTMEFARDKHFVYHGEHKLDGADPESFGLLSYNQCRNPPPGIHFHSDQVELGAGWIGVDRMQAWEVDFANVGSLQVSPANLKTLQNDLRKALGASAHAVKQEFDRSRCTVSANFAAPRQCPMLAVTP